MEVNAVGDEDNCTEEQTPDFVNRSLKPLEGSCSQAEDAENVPPSPNEYVFEALAVVVSRETMSPLSPSAKAAMLGKTVEKKVARAKNWRRAVECAEIMGALILS
jgi:hypothetical protein